MQQNKIKIGMIKTKTTLVRIVIIAILFLQATILSCKSVKPYQKQHLNDHYMQTNALGVEKLENEADTYREGMQGGLDGKSGGGCGCN